MKFEKVAVINLDRRPDRLAGFWKRLRGAGSPFTPERVVAIDGQRCPPPATWRYGAGAWGCTRSHLRLYEEALTAGQNLLVFEDDTCFVPDFAERLPQFLAAVPDDWDMVYLGGSHQQPIGYPPERVNEHVLRARGVGCCTAYGINRRFLELAYPLLMGAEPHIIDHQWCRLQLANRWNIYCPPEWLCGQAEGASDVGGRDEQERYWNFEEPTTPARRTLNFFRARPIEGWFSGECAEVYRREALAAIQRIGTLATLVEVGCWKGLSLSALADYIRGGDLVACAVDTWAGAAGQSAYAEFVRNMNRLGISQMLKVVRRPSLVAAEQFLDETLDLVMLDDDHTYPHVRQELAAWWPKVAPGGTFMGHDFMPHNGWPGVIQAVTEFAEELGLPIEVEADLWIVRKPPEPTAEQARDREQEQELATVP